MIKNHGKKKDDQVRLNTIVYTTLEIVRKISFMLFPIIPESSLKALKIFNIKENQIELSSIQNHKYLEEGSSINKIDILFKKIEKNPPIIIYLIIIMNTK